MLKKLILQGISDGIFPGAVAYVSKAGELIFYEAFGNRMVKPEVKPMHKDTIFDLASLTKVVATTTLALMLAEKEQIDLEGDVADYLPEFERRGVTIKHLLTHTSGLPAWKPLYLDPGDATKVIEHLGTMPLEYQTGTKVVYSCLGYILLGKLLERVAKAGLDELADGLIFKPLGMRDTLYNPPPEMNDNCAATEEKNSFEKRMGQNLNLDTWNRYDWRDGVIVGKVHDENAHFLGGISGNAGLFSTAMDLAKFCEMLTSDGGGILSKASIELMAENHTLHLDASRGFGWIILEDGSLYHTGFTGTSIRVNLKRKLIAILLTNRVHPDASKVGIVDFRARFYNHWLRHASCTS